MRKLLALLCAIAALVAAFLAGRAFPANGYISHALGDDAVVRLNTSSGELIIIDQRGGPIGRLSAGDVPVELWRAALELKETGTNR